MFPIRYIMKQCEIVAYCFLQSGRDGFDSKDFAEKMMNSEYGTMVLEDRRMIEYSDRGFMYEGILRGMTFNKGEVYDGDVLYLAGYLYKYWISTRNAKAQEIYKIAPIELIDRRYGFYHTQDFDYIINDIIDRPYKSKG